MPEVVFRDRWRQNGLPELEWMVLRFTCWDVMCDPRRGSCHRATLLCAGERRRRGWSLLEMLPGRVGVV